MKNNYFIPFTSSFSKSIIPSEFISPYKKVHKLADLAAKELIQYLTDLNNKKNNFNQLYETKGKMFGVLVVKDSNNKIGYLRGFSGKIGNTSHYATFVPPIVDLKEETISIDSIMTEISTLTVEIETIRIQESENLKLKTLIDLRKNKSIALQQTIFNEYFFLNSKKESKQLKSIFSDYNCKSSPAGAGECSAPKLFQFAFQQNLTPIALAEFWWGKPPKSGLKKCNNYYPPCNAKCKPILAYMLKGL